MYKLNMSNMATSTVAGDKYRIHIYGEGEKNTKWKYGAPPNYDVVNKLFEEGRTKVLSLSCIILLSVYLYKLILGSKMMGIFLSS